MTSATDPVRAGHDAFADRSWGEAYTALATARDRGEASAEDLAQLATAAFLTGRDDDSQAALEAAHEAFLRQGRTRLAARCAFWLAMSLLNRGQEALGGGWLARARRLLDDEPACVEQGYLEVPAGLRCLAEGDARGAHERFSAAAAAAERFDDPDLAALARLGQGDALLHEGAVHEGLALLDEVMVSVQAGEVSPVPAGLIYCAVIDACQSSFDLRRAQEWTAALSAWCRSQPDLVPYRGQCLIHRSQLLQYRGAWNEALTEAARACERLSAPPHPAVGEAHYQRAELHRLRGEVDEAESAYREANRHGRVPQPGLALLRLAQGRVDAARAALLALLDTDHDAARRARLLAAYVEVALAGDDVSAARSAADDLGALASRIDVPMLHAIAAHIDGAVLLVEGEVGASLASLRRAWSLWRELDAPYEAARVRVLLGLACRELGDEDGARLEFEAAREVLSELGAGPELARLGELAGQHERDLPGGLTPREVEVLRWVAQGETNRRIADVLVISEHTVARHVQNIFTKIGVSSRTAAAAYAFEHDLL